MLDEREYRKLVAPQSVAMVGVTSRTGKGSNNPLEMLIEAGYKGKIYPVNPRGKDILGITTYRSVLDLPEVPDLAVICAPRHAVPELFVGCAEKGIKMVIIVAQGFADANEEGKAMQKEILSLAAEKGIRIIGPNTLGVVNNLDGFCTSFMRFINPTAATGVLCQSGVFVVAAAVMSCGTGIGVDTGNACDIEFADLLWHMACDPRLKMICMHMEGVRDGARFVREARRVPPIKPVVVYKTGRSEAGARVAGSHTGSMAGEDAVFDAAFKQCGLIRASDVEEMHDLSKTFLTFDGIPGNRVAVISISGGAGIVAMDACHQYGLEVAELSPQTMELLRELYPDWMRPENPVDVWPAAMLHGYHEVYGKILRALLDDPQVDAVLCITASFLGRDEDFLDVAALIREAAAARRDKPVVAYTYGARYLEYIEKLEEDKNVVAFPSVDRAIRALGALYRYHHRLKLRPAAPEPLPPNDGRERVRALLEGRPAGFLSQADSFRVLEAYGIPVARWGTAASLEEALTLAGEIGYPVVMKAEISGVTHKSDVGGVVLDIRRPEELETAYRELFRGVAERCPGATVTQVVLQEYRTGGVEVLLGCKRDPQFGPVVAAGTGGTLTELYRDIALRVAPVDRADVREMLGESKVGRLLGGFRGMPPADEDALVDAVLKLSQLALDFPQVMEVDINPVLAGPDGVAALDARILLG